MAAQGGAILKVARSINNIWNSTTQHYQQQTQQQQAGTDPGRTQEALARFCKGPETPICHCTRMLLFLKLHSDGLLRLVIQAVNTAHPGCLFHLCGQTVRPGSQARQSGQRPPAAAGESPNAAATVAAAASPVSVSGASYQWCQLVCCTTRIQQHLK